jgi:hypothetical protein
MESLRVAVDLKGDSRNGSTRIRARAEDRDRSPGRFHEAPPRWGERSKASTTPAAFEAPKVEIEFMVNCKRTHRQAGGEEGFRRRERFIQALVT